MLSLFQAQTVLDAVYEDVALDGYEPRKDVAKHDMQIFGAP